jgi:hypothetical protein
MQRTWVKTAYQEMEDKENNDHWKTIQKINEKLQQKYVEY